MNIKNWSALKIITVSGMILGVLVLGCSAVLAIFVFSLLKSSGAFTGSLERIQESPAARELLGEPIEPGIFVLGSTQTRSSLGTGESSGESRISYKISGPRGSGKAFVEATMEDGVWTFEKISISSGLSAESLELADPETLSSEGLPLLEKED